MGYYTYYNLEVQPVELLESVTEAMKTSGIIDLEYMVKGGFYGYEAKWYDCKEELVAFSKLVPDATLILEGEGESSMDKWKFSVKNGEVLEEDHVADLWDSEVGAMENRIKELESALQEMVRLIGPKDPDEDGNCCDLIYADDEVLRRVRLAEALLNTEVAQ